MVKPRDEAIQYARRVAKKLGIALSEQEEISEEESKAAQRRLAKAVFHSHYKEGEFETALNKHQRMMGELGEGIEQLLRQFRKQWKKYKKKGEHRGYHHKKKAKGKIKRVISLQERIDAHLKRYEKKLSVLSAWRQHKVENDIGSEVQLSDIHRFISEEYDEFEINETTFEEEEAEEIIGAQKGTDGAVISEEEEELFDQFVEEEFGDGVEAEGENSEQEVDFEGIVEEGGDSGDDEDEGDEEVDDEVREFIKEELE
jgi:hypothetical protein